MSALAFREQKCLFQLIRQSDGLRSEVMQATPTDFAEMLSEKVDLQEDLVLVLCLADFTLPHWKFETVPLMTVSHFVSSFGVTENV